MLIWRVGAAYNGYAKVIEVLSAANADVHYTKSGSGETALYYACLQGRLAAVKALLAANARHSDALFDNSTRSLASSAVRVLRVNELHLRLC